MMPSPWLIVAGDFAPSGGMDKANYELAWHLAERRGREVRLVAHRVAEPLAAHPRVRVLRVPRPLGRHLVGGPLLARAGRGAARAFLREFPDGRVVVNGGNCRWPGVNWVHMVHATYPRSDGGAPVSFRLRNRLTRALDRYRERRALRCSRLVIANSERTRRQIIEAVGVDAGRVRVVYLGTDPGHYGPVGREERDVARRRFGLGDEPAVVFVGAVGYDANKGLDTLLRACRHLPASLSRLTTLVAGGGALDHWRRQAAAAGLADRVRLLGQVGDVATLMAAADLLVSPTRYDAYGLAVHEAVCRGLPVVVSRAAGVSERFPPDLQCLLLNDPDDDVELAGRIAGALPARADCLRGLGRFAAVLRGHTWEHMGEEMIDLIEANS
jgi:glycosyltransferase involved in cell wall biosynthesis